MANVRSGNIWYVDGTTEQLSENRITVMYVIVTPDGGASPQIVVKNRTQVPSIKLDLRTDTTKSQQFSFEEEPIVFEEGIQATTVTNCTAMFILKERGI